MKIFLPILLIIAFCSSSELFGQGVEEYKAAFQNANEEDQMKALFQICEYYFITERNRDSLRFYGEQLTELMKDKKYDSNRLKAEMYLCLTIKDYNDETIKRIEDALSKGEELGEKAILAELYSKMANINLAKGNYRSAIKNGNLAKAAIEEVGVESIPDGKKLQCLVIGNLAVSYGKKGDYLQALEHAIQNQKLADSIGDKQLQYSAITKFIGIYGDLASEEKMYGTEEERAGYQKLLEEYLMQAFEFSRNTGKKKYQAISALNMSIFYALDSNLTTSQKFIDTCIILSKEIGHKQILTEAYSIKADNFSDLHQRDTAIHYETMALNGARDLGHNDLEVSIGLDMAAHYIIYGNLSRAEDYLSEAYSIAEREKFYPKIKRANYQYYEIAQKMGDFEKALAYYQKYVHLKDSIVNEETKADLAELNAKYQTELKEKEIEVLKNEKELNDLTIKRKNNLIVFGLLFSLVTCGFLYFYFRAKNEIERQKALNSKQKLLRSQLNPHFLFNALNSIQQFIYQKVDPTQIADYLAKFSRLTRRILINSKEDFISLEEEIEFLRDYMDLQQIRFDKPFHYEIDIGEELNVDEISIPPMFTQPFIENSIEHGILNKKDAGEINITFAKSGEQLLVKIEDNGIGIEKSIFMKKNNRHRSLATEITRERISMIEKRLTKKASLDIEDRTKKGHLITGTAVTLKLPIIYL